MALGPEHPILSRISIHVGFRGEHHNRTAVHNCDRRIHISKTLGILLLQSRVSPSAFISV